MSQDTVEKIFGLLGALIVSVFVLGLAESISSGFAGFWGGFPLMILPLVFYDYWDTCFRKKD